MNLSNQELSYWLALVKIPTLGPRRIFKLLEQVSEIKELYGQSEKFYDNIGVSQTIVGCFKKPDWGAVSKDFAWLSQSKDHAIVTITSDHYPKQLLATSTPPVILYIKGNLDVLNASQIAVVGSRRPSPEGKEIAYELSKDLGTNKIIVTSGLAHGIDTASHLGALENYHTIAVLGTGIDIIYPSSNHKLAERIVDKGAIVSELPLRAPALAEHFPRRNRIISGLSVGTCIIEANEKSGSLITANYALEQGREVFAVPGSIRNPRSRGCHYLIKQGASLVTNAQDILFELGFPVRINFPISSSERLTTNFELEEAHLKLLECIGYEPAKIDVLVERTNFPVKTLARLLIDLEIAGLICSNFSGYRRVS